MKKVFFLLFHLISVLTALGQEDTRVHSFLRLPVSAHATALGGDNISVIENDGALVLHNPALLSSVDDKLVTLNYLGFMGDAKMMSATYAHIINDRLTLGGAAQYMGYGKMTQTNEQGNVIGDFSPMDLAFTASVAYLLWDNWSAGINTKLAYSHIASYQAWAMGVDLGINYYNPDNEWSVSAVVKNLGGQIKPFNDTYENLPIDLQLGISKRFVGSPLRISLTMVDLHRWNNPLLEHMIAGLDLILSKQIWVGVGYRIRSAKTMVINTYDGSTSGAAGLSLGGGITLNRFQIQAAYSKYHKAGGALAFNLSYTL